MSASLGQLETREIRAGQGSKSVTEVMKLLCQWRQLHEPRVLLQSLVKLTPLM